MKMMAMDPMVKSDEWLKAVIAQTRVLNRSDIDKIAPLLHCTDEPHCTQPKSVIRNASVSPINCEHTSILSTLSATKLSKIFVSE